MKITTKQINDSIEVSIEDEANHLGVKFTAPLASLATSEGLEKAFNLIADYVNQNYECLHKKNDRGITFVK